MNLYKHIGIYSFAAWAVIAALSLMVVGGLVLWAYGARRAADASLKSAGPEGEAARDFHVRLSRWFFLYGAGVIVAGGVLLLWASSVLF